MITSTHICLTPDALTSALLFKVFISMLSSAISAVLSSSHLCDVDVDDLRCGSLSISRLFESSSSGHSMSTSGDMLHKATVRFTNKSNSD